MYKQPNKNYEIYLMNFKNKEVRTAIKRLEEVALFCYLTLLLKYQAHLFLESNVEML